MRGMRIAGIGLAVGLAGLAMVAAALRVAAQDRPKVEVVPYIPHSSKVSSVAFSANGTHVLSGSEDNTIKLWNAATGALIRTFQGHSKPVLSVRLSPDSARVVSGGWDRTIKLWDAVTGALVHTFEGHSGWVNSVAFSPDGARVLSGSNDSTVKLWDTATGTLIRTFLPQPSGISNTGSVLRTHSDWVNAVAFSPDGDRVLSGSDDSTMKLWDTATGALIRTIDGLHGHIGSYPSQMVKSAAFSPDGTRVLSGGGDGTIKLWNAATGALLRAFEQHSGGVYSVAFSPDGTRVLSGGGDGTIKLWNTATGAVIHTFRGHSRRVTSVALSPDGAHVLSGSDDYTIKLWDAATGALLRTVEGHANLLWTAAFSPDGTRVISGSDDGIIELWDAVSGALIRSFQEGHSMPVKSLAFSADGAHLLTLSDGWLTSGEIKLWDATTGAVVRTFQKGATASAFSADGARVLSAGGGGDAIGITLWDAATGDRLRTFKGHTHTIWSVTFSPDGTRLLSGSEDNTTKLWDTATGQLIRTFKGAGPVHSVAFSADGARVLSGSGELVYIGRYNTIRLWDVATGALIRTFRGHSGPVLSVAFSPDGARVLSGSWDGTIKLWDVATGALIRTFRGHSRQVRSVAFSPDGARVLSGGLDTTVRIWNPKTDQVTLLLARDNAWLAMTRAGFFAASSNSSKMVAIVRGLDATSIDQVHQSLFNPDLVRETLSGDPSGEAQRAAEVVNLESILESRPPPAVAITSPAPDSHATADLLAVTARITDKGKGVGRVEWRVNGVTAAVASDRAGSGPEYTVTRELALDPGTNVIEVVAYNRSNLLASVPARAIVKFTAPPHQAKPRLHVLAIGVNEYVDQGWTPPGSSEVVLFPKLGLAVKDAVAIAEDLNRAGADQYADVRVTLALDEDASRDKLDRTIDRLAAEISPRDTFIFFAAVHGISHNGRFYLIPQDYSGGSNPASLKDKAIGQDRLQDWFANRIKAKKAIILLDTCESGALVAGYLRSRIDGAASEAGVGRLHEATGRPVLTAAALGQFAYEGLIGRRSGTRHGLFTWALLDALRKGDANNDQLIELSELVAHVQALVPKLAADLGGTGRSAFALPSLSVHQSARFGSRGEDFAVVRRLH